MYVPFKKKIKSSYAVLGMDVFVSFVNCYSDNH